MGRLGSSLAGKERDCLWRSCWCGENSRGVGQALLVVGSFVCALRFLSLCGLDLLFSEDSFSGCCPFSLPSFPALPTLKARSNHRVAVSVVGQQAALVTRRQLGQSPALPQHLPSSPAVAVFLRRPSGSGWDRQRM